MQGGGRSPRIYDKELRGVGKPVARADCQHVYHLYVIRDARRDQLMADLQSRDIGALIHYPVPVHLQASHRDLGMGAGSLPHTEAAAREILSAAALHWLERRGCLARLPRDKRLAGRVMDYGGAFAGARALVTGGMGFTGSNLVIALAGAGADVTIVDAMLPGYAGNLFNIAPVRERVTVNYCDVRDEHAMNHLVRGQDYVFHLAGQVDHVLSLTDPFPDIDINIKGTAVVMEALRKHNPRARIIYTGTRGQYGEAVSLPVAEDAPHPPQRHLRNQQFDRREDTRSLWRDSWHRSRHAALDKLLWSARADEAPALWRGQLVPAPGAG